MFKMEEVKALKQEVNQLTISVNLLNQKFEDHFLTKEEKGLIDEAIEEKNQGKLLEVSDVF